MQVKERDFVQVWVFVCGVGDEQIGGKCINQESKRKTVFAGNFCLKYALWCLTVMKMI
jgi:hypothetical protein